MFIRVRKYICGGIMLLLLMSCTSKKNDLGDNSGLPKVEFEGNRSVERNNKDHTLTIPIKLTDISKKQIRVDYTTKDGTAEAGKDFVLKNGTLEFERGQVKRSLNIQILGDSLRQKNQYFYVLLKNPENAELGLSKIKVTIINNGTYWPTDDKGFQTPKSYAGYHLVWSDEFKEDKLNLNEWNYETGTGDHGWGNNELEYYTSRPENIFISSGNLIIEARKEDYKGSSYTSARITTQGKKEFTYGRVDIRAKLPVAHGLWPALWMLGSNLSSSGWPECGETDIMEVVGSNPGQVVGSLHWKGASGAEETFNNTHDLSSGDFSDEFHVFSLLWQRDSISILVDDIPYVKADRSDLSGGTYPFDDPSFFIFNVAVGGDWPGAPDQSTQFPQRMIVDYIRVFQKN